MKKHGAGEEPLADDMDLATSGDVSEDTGVPVAQHDREPVGGHGHAGAASGEAVEAPEEQETSAADEAGDGVEISVGAASGEQAEVPEEQEVPVANEAGEQALEGLRQEVEKYRDALLRRQAEFDNLRKRTLRDVEQAHKFALEDFVQALIPVLDSLEQGLAAAGTNADDPTELHEGMVLIHKQMVTVLGRFGVDILEPVGEKFDPERHQAMTSQAGSGEPRGTILSVFQKGYILNGRLVRPAMVVVAN